MKTKYTNRYLYWLNDDEVTLIIFLLRKDGSDRSIDLLNHLQEAIIKKNRIKGD